MNLEQMKLTNPYIRFVRINTMFSILRTSHLLKGAKSYETFLFFFIKINKDPQSLQDFADQPLDKYHG
jgi:hypothetical protein